ncbi:MAG: TIGR02391 family protein [Terriglobales bacterium]
MPSYEELEHFSIPKQAQLLLLNASRFAQIGSFNIYNLNMPPWGLASDFPEGQRQAVTELLLGAPLKFLENQGLIRFKEHSNYVITPSGHKAVQGPALSFFAVQEIMAALPLLHPDFHGYAHFFYDNKLKEAVAAAFERYENKLNEIRSGSISPTVRAASGHPLVFRLFAEGELVRPYPALGAKDSYEKGLTGILSGALEWIRNPYTHQKHELPDLTPSEALELLFVASYLMRMLELSKP